MVQPQQSSTVRRGKGANHDHHRYRIRHQSQRCSEEWRPQCTAWNGELPRLAVTMRPVYVYVYVCVCACIEGVGGGDSHQCQQSLCVLGGRKQKVKVGQEASG